MPYPQNYDAFGNIIQTQMDANPTDNPGLVYDPAQSPVPPGALQPGQAIASLTFQSGYSQRRIRISMNPEQNPTQSPGSLAVISEDGQLIGSIGSEVGSTGNNAPVLYGSDIVGNSALVAERRSTVSSATNSVVLVIDNSSSTLGPEVTYVTLTIHNTHFSQYQGFSNPLLNSGLVTSIWVGDGTDPNGVLPGTAGDLCLNGAANKPAYCVGGTVWANLV